MEGGPSERVPSHQRPVVEGSTLHLSEILRAGGALLQNTSWMKLLTTKSVGHFEYWGQDFWQEALLLEFKGFRVNCPFKSNIVSCDIFLVVWWQVPLQPRPFNKLWPLLAPKSKSCRFPFIRLRLWASNCKLPHAATLGRAPTRYSPAVKMASSESTVHTQHVSDSRSETRLRLRDVRRRVNVSVKFQLRPRDPSAESPAPNTPVWATPRANATHRSEMSASKLGRTRSCWNHLGVADLVLSGVSDTRSAHRVPGTHTHTHTRALTDCGVQLNKFDLDLEHLGYFRNGWTFDCHLVMQVRVLTEAPPPQLREHTDQPLHVAHSFLKCSCRRARAGHLDGDPAEGPRAEIQDCETNDRHVSVSVFLHKTLVHLIFTQVS